MKSGDEIGVGPHRFLVDLGDLDPTALGLAQGEDLSATLKLPRNLPPPPA